MISIENNILRVKGTIFEIGAEISEILISTKVNDKIPLEIYSSAIHTFMFNGLTKEERSKFLDDLKSLCSHFNR